MNARKLPANANRSFDRPSQLRLAMGVSVLPGGDPTDLPVASHGSEEGELEALVARAVKARPELEALSLQEEAQRRIADSARGAYWPTFGLTLAVTDAGTELTNRGWNMSAGIGLTWNFYQGGLTSAQVRQAEAVLEGLAANVEGGSARESRRCARRHRFSPDPDRSKAARRRPRSPPRAHHASRSDQGPTGSRRPAGRGLALARQRPA